LAPDQINYRQHLVNVVALKPDTVNRPLSLGAGGGHDFI
jgi:hypothetical protein